MDQLEFDRLLHSLSGFSPEQLQAISREVDAAIARLGISNQPASPDSDEDLQRRLLAAGIISEIKPPIRVETGTERRSAVPIIGEPLSETVIRERR